MSRSILCWLALLALVGSLSAQTPAQKPEPVLDVSSMDASVNPCEDFYNYSCGGWMKKNPIPPDQISWGVSTKLQDENLLVLRDILEKAAEPDPNRNAITQKIGDYYAACMDEKSINAAELAPLKKEIQAIDRLQSKEDIAALAASMIDDDVLFDFHSNQDYKNSEQVIAEVDQGGISLRTETSIFCRTARPLSCARNMWRMCAVCSICWATRRASPKMNPTR